MRISRTQAPSMSDCFLWFLSVNTLFFLVVTTILVLKINCIRVKIGVYTIDFFTPARFNRALIFFMENQLHTGENGVYTIDFVALRAA